MKMNERCIPCVINRQYDRIANEQDPNKKLIYMKQILKIIADSSNEETMPWITNTIEQLYNKTFPELQLSYTDIKKYYNQMVLQLENDIHKKISQQNDPLKYAIQLAIVGNYIDYGALKNVNANFFINLLEKANKTPINKKTYTKLKQDLEKSTSLLYICDNCGEIVLDKILIKQLLQQYPHLKIQAMVRGDEIINDATMADAKEVGLTNICNVIDNGLALAGTDLNHISQKALNAIHNADIIFSKGQANFETLCDNQLPIYYLLLCKCDLFANRFNLEKYTGVLFHEEAK